MAQSFESGYASTLSQKFSSTDVIMYVATPPTVTAGRIYLTDGSQKERVSFSGVSGSTLTGCVRGLSRTADPATAGTGLNWLAGNPIVLVAQHDQLRDKQQATEALIYGKTYATTAARDAALGANGAATHPYTNVYVTATGLHYNYNLSTAQWEAASSGTATPNGSTTVAGKVEEATLAQIVAMTQAGETGADLFINPSTVKLVKDYCIVVNSGTQSITSDSATLINLATYTTNNTIMDDTANKIKIATAGTYIVTAHCNWNAGAAANVSSLTLYNNLGAINGTYYVDYRTNGDTSVQGGDVYEHISVVCVLAVNDLISIEAYQMTSGGTARTLVAASISIAQLV